MSDATDYGARARHGRLRPGTNERPTGATDGDAGPAASRELCVLVADDDDDFRESLVEVLELLGWRALEARDGDEALALLRRETVDLALLDHRMPRRTGVEVVEALRAEGAALPPIALMSAHRDLVELAAAARLRHYVRKPFGLHELRVIVERIIEAPAPQ